MEFLNNLAKVLQKALRAQLCNLRPHTSTVFESNSLTLVKEIRKVRETGDSSTT